MFKQKHKRIMNRGVMRVREPSFFRKHGRLLQAGGAVLFLCAGLIFSLRGEAGPIVWGHGTGLGTGIDIMGFAFMLAAFILSGWNILLAAVRNLVSGRVLDEYFLMSVASVSAFALGEYVEGVAVLVLFQIGEFFQDRAVSRSRSSIRSVLAMRSETAHLVISGENGGSAEMVDIHPSRVRIGSIVSLRAGERIPLDGTVVEGSGYVDTSPVTGESVPVFVRPGDAVYSGSITAGSGLLVRTDSAFEDSTASRIIRLVEDAAARKTASERFLARFSRIYTPSVVAAAVLVGLLPPLLFGGDFREWIFRGLVFLVVSCPCALAVSVPLTVFSGIGAASRTGILVKGGGYLETLARAGQVVFDKTGTLTTGEFGVSAVWPEEGFGSEDLLRYAAGAEEHSNHPLAGAIVREARRQALSWTSGTPREFAGLGIAANVDGLGVLVGSERFIAGRGVGIPGERAPAGGSAVDPGPAGSGFGGSGPADGDSLIFVAVDSRFAGRISLRDTLKPDAAETIRGCAAAGLRKTVLLSGDSRETTGAFAGRLGMDEWHGALLPHEKVERLEDLMNDRAGKETVLAVGDGINDAPLLARADAGIAMGGLGSHAAMEAADIVIMSDEPSRVLTAVQIGKRTGRIVRENIAISLFFKLAVLGLGVFGMAPLWAAVFADVGVALLAVLNALRAFSVPRNH